MSTPAVKCPGGATATWTRSSRRLALHKSSVPSHKQNGSSEFIDRKLIITRLLWIIGDYCLALFSRENSYLSIQMHVGEFNVTGDKISHGGYLNELEVDGT